MTTPSFLLFSLIVIPLVAQEPPPLFTSSTNNVLVDVAVTNNQLRVVELQREDFVLLENGHAREIAGIAHDELPLDIVLVCQVPLQGGFSQERLNTSQRLMNAAANAVLGIHPGDRVAMVTYGRDPHIALRFTADRKAIVSAIKRFGDPENADENIVISSEALAIEYAVRMIADVERDDPNASRELAGTTEPSAVGLGGVGGNLKGRAGPVPAGADRRRLIILVSNVFGVGPRYADEPIIRGLWDQNTLLSVIEDTPPTSSTAAVQRSSGGDSQTVLFQRYNPIHIAQATGGDRIVAPVPQDPGAPQHPGDLLTPIRQRYVLSFHQPSDAAPGESRTIKVDLSEAARSRLPDAVVKAREGYVTR